MTSLSDGDPLQNSGTASPELNPSVRKLRPPTGNESPETSSASLPLRTSTPPFLATRSNTLNTENSRSSSPSGRPSFSALRLGRSSVASTVNNPSETYDDIRTLIVRSFSPTVAVYAASDADDLARRKGVKRGFCQLIRPYGERIQGKIVIRDSVGASRTWDDFGVSFADLGALALAASAEPERNELGRLEGLMDQYVERDNDKDDSDGVTGEMSPYYRIYLSRLLQAHGISPHETFRHPVATIIAISSATPQPIETLRQLYQHTAQGSRALPAYSNPEYLRYYVLVHDEDQDDLAKSSALFDQMKRHFGLHCHLLRLRSAPCTHSDHDTEEIPSIEWVTPAEDLSRLQETANLIDLDAPTSVSIRSEDAAAIRTFTRELVAQSVVPHMEQRIATWNDQIASRRRGISGRFMSLSKRWAGLGGSARNASSATNLIGSGASGNYDNIQGLYRYDTPEALLRKLADYCFMLRDYKLAASTYELLRSDYTNDKSWKYLAGANEMCCVANLLNPLTGTASAKFKAENFDQMIETATYSYLTRCSDPTLTMRTILLSLELLKVRGKTASEIAARWAMRALDLSSGGSVEHVLISERIANCFAGQIGIGNTSWGTRKRKAALWNITSADEWMKLGRAGLAANKIDEAHELYLSLKNGESMKQFEDLDQFMQQLQLSVRMKLSNGRHRAFSGASRHTQEDLMDGDDTVEDMTSLEKLDARPSNRRGTVGGANPMEMVAPMSPTRLRSDPLADDDFE